MNKDKIAQAVADGFVKSVGPAYNPLPKHHVDAITDEIMKLIEAAPVVYGKADDLEFWGAPQSEADKFLDTHQARLICIEEIKKECFKHEPKLIVNEDGYNQRTICKHCGIDLVAIWLPKAKGE